MPSAYMIAQIDVTDPETYKKYTAQTPGVIAKYGGEFIVRGGTVDSKEGEPPLGRVVVVRFPSMEQAQTFYNSGDYGPLIELRQSASNGSLFIVEGAD
jgi:uncharacterized protein (DUF1330 family)